MSEIVPLQIHPWPTPHMEIVKAAKVSLDTDVKVLPTPAAPGLHGRVLALGELPPWVCDAALVREPELLDSVQKALEWLLAAPEGDTRGFMVADYMEAWLGATELPPPACHCGEPVSVRDYSPLMGCAFCHDNGCHLADGLCFRD